MLLNECRLPLSPSTEDPSKKFLTRVLAIHKRYMPTTPHHTQSFDVSALSCRFIQGNNSMFCRTHALSLNHSKPPLCKSCTGAVCSLRGRHILFFYSVSGFNLPLISGTCMRVRNTLLSLCHAGYHFGLAVSIFTVLNTQFRGRQGRIVKSRVSKEKKRNPEGT